MSKRNKNSVEKAGAFHSVATSSEDLTKVKKKRRPDNFQRAKEVFEKLQNKKRKEVAKKLEEKERREKALQSYMSTKKKMNKALLRKNRKGQPNLGAQIQVLLEKIQKKP